MPPDMRDYPWQVTISAERKARRRGTYRRLGEKIGGALGTIGLCLAIGSAVGAHWPHPLPNYAPAPGVPVVAGPHHAPAKLPHVHLHGYLIYRTARWAFRRGW